MATTTEQKYAALKPYTKADTDENSAQLIYPIDLVNVQNDHPGHVVVFEPNVIRGLNINAPYENSSAYIKSLNKSGSRIDGAYGSEVDMQSKDTSSIRGKRGFTDTDKAKANNQLYKKSDERIVLPMPLQVNVTYACNWQTTELGALGSAIDMANSVKDMNLNTARKQAMEGAGRTLAGAVQSLGISNTKDYVELTTGTTANSYTELLFKGVNNRMIPFTYTFTPRNDKEARVVRSIIHRLKYHMMPSYKYEGSNNSYLLHPSTFDISFIDLKTGAHNPWMFKISTCALTNISINGTPNGEYVVLENGQYASVVVDMMFTEMIQQSKENMISPTDTY